MVVGDRIYPLRGPIVPGSDGILTSVGSAVPESSLILGQDGCTLGTVARRNLTPAMAGGVSDHIWTCEEIAALLD